jgi:hypothetical protein
MLRVRSSKNETFCSLARRESTDRTRDRHGQLMKLHGNVDSAFIGSQVFPSRSSHDNARSSPARTRSSISRCGSRNVCGTKSRDCGFAVPAPVKSHASGGTVSMSDFLFILVDLTESIVDFLCAPVGSWLPTRSVYPLYLARQSVKPVFFLTKLQVLVKLQVPSPLRSQRIGSG